MIHSKEHVRSKNGNKDTKAPDALTAVAFQDHLLRSMNLSLTSGLSTKPNLNKRLAYKKPKGKSVVDCHLNSKAGKAKPKVTEEKEYVLDTLPPPPTLAQRLGLVEQPKSLMNETDWALAKSKAQQREDFSQPCVICKEDIGKICHVILSCSHVFHKNCLQAFERFSGKKTCPMCRVEQYQTRVIYDGANPYRHKCAARIQAAWRGYIVRCWYKKLRETTPPKDPTLRQKYFEEKLKTITDRMVACMDLKVNNLLYEVSKNLENSRLVFEQFDARQKIITMDDWMKIHEKAAVRNQSECPICLSSLHTEESSIINKSCVLTSCSHLFHDTCLTMFETLSVSEDCHNSCPVCRSAYQKQVQPSLT